MSIDRWTVYDPEEEKGKRFPGLPWTDPLNIEEGVDPDSYPPNSIGARQQKRMKMLIEDKLGDEAKTNLVLVQEAMRLSGQVMQGVDTVDDVINVARKTIEISSKPF